MDRSVLYRGIRLKKKIFHYRSLIFYISTLLSILFISYHHFRQFSNPRFKFPQCSFERKRFMSYTPHSGFSNQVYELKNAILMATILNRTLIVPPVMDHHALALGSCPKFRVLAPNQLRIAAWDHIFHLVRAGRYISMADIIDLSPLVSSYGDGVQTIDFRDFVSLWCGIDLNFRCFNSSDSRTLLTEKLKQCGSLLSGSDGSVDKCLYAVHEDCRTTVWTYRGDGEDGDMDSFQPDEQLKKRKKILHVRKRRDVYKILGPDSKAGLASVLAFGSLFTAPYKNSELYIDIHRAPSDQRIENLIEKIEFLPFVPEIMGAGKKFVHERINTRFFCAQLRLLDGQFKNHGKVTFMRLKQMLEALRNKEPLPIHVFVMTDLPESNWTENYLGDLIRDKNSFKIHVLREEDEFVVRTSKKLVSNRMNHCSGQLLPNVLLYLEEAVCSCASLGFSGTVGSTIAENIELMRKFGVCID